MRAASVVPLLGLVLLLVFVLGLAACSDEPTSRSVDFGTDAVMRVSIVAPGGTVRLERGTATRVEVSARGVGGDPDIERDLTISLRDGVLRVEDPLSHDHEKWLLQIVVTVATKPAVVALTTRTAGVTVHGEWDKLNASVVTRGDIDVDVDAVQGGEIKTADGSVRLVARRAAPGEDLMCSSIRGDVAVEVPADFHGAFQLRAREEAGLKISPHERLRTTPVDEDGRTRRGWVGEPLTQADRDNAGAMWRDPPTIWAKADHGTASFALR
jgi:hypothetical protein